MKTLTECISPSSSHSDQKFGGIFASDKRDYESSGSSSSIVVGAITQSAVSFRETNGRGGSDNDNASGAGYGPPDNSRDLDLGFLIRSFISPQTLIPVNSS